jgi:hypothetical protein
MAEHGATLRSHEDETMRVDWPEEELNPKSSIGGGHRSFREQELDTGIHVMRIFSLYPLLRSRMSD